MTSDIYRTVAFADVERVWGAAEALGRKQASHASAHRGDHVGWARMEIFVSW